MDETPTTAEGHTRVPNVFLDQWMPILIPSIVVLFLFIFRRVANTSQGRRNGGYSISLAQFCAPTEKAAAGFLEGGTGLSRSTVKEGLRSLVVDYELIGRKPGKGTSAPFYYLKPIPEAIPDRRTIDSRRTAATGLKSDTVASPESGLNSDPQGVENQPAGGLKFDTVLLEETTPEGTQEKTPPKIPPSVAVAVRSSGRFAEWWGIWSLVMGTNHKQRAEQAFGSVVTVDLEKDCFECTHAYVASRGDRNGGFYPENFLRDQAKDRFTGRMPAWKRPFDRNQERRENVNTMTKSLLGKRL